MQKQAEHRPYRHSDVVGQSVVPQSFSSSGRRHDVDDQGVAAYGHHSEGKTVNDTKNDKQGQYGGSHVSGKNQRKDEVSQQV